jgi:hypothetical protein
MAIDLFKNFGYEFSENEVHKFKGKFADGSMELDYCVEIVKDRGHYNGI